jgi:hypothetical protein
MPEILKHPFAGKLPSKIQEPIQDQVIERIPEADNGDPNTLKNFLKWAKELYPAQNYLVVLEIMEPVFDIVDGLGGPVIRYQQELL